MDQLMQNFIGTVVRWALMIAAGWLVNAGLLQQGSQVEWVTGIAAGLVALIWGIYQKYFAHKLLTTALNLPPGVTIQEVRELAKGKG